MVYEVQPGLKFFWFGSRKLTTWADMGPPTGNREAPGTMGKGSRHSEVGTEEDAEKPTKKTTMSAGSGAEDQHLCMYSVTSNLLLSLNEPSSLFYLINWTV